MIDLKKIDPATSLNIIALSVLNFLLVFYFYKIPTWHIFLFSNLILILSFIYLSQKNKIGIAKLFFDWLPFLIILYIFKESYFMIHFINPTDYDNFFIAVDKWIFGFNPTEELFKISNPFLTEILQIAYFLYYFIFLAVPFELYLKNKTEDFRSVSFLILFGFYLSYIGYFLFPGVGPRFTLHDFNLISSELPGIFLTEPIRNFLNFAESIPQNSNAIDFVQRDLFPSGHVELTLVAIYSAFKLNLKSKNLLLILGMLLIFSTIYLRYHYFIDIIFGVLFFFLTIFLGNKILKKIEKI